MKYVKARLVEALLNNVDSVIEHIYDEPISTVHESKEEAYEHGVYSGTRDGKYMAYISIQSKLKRLLSEARFFNYKSARRGIGEWLYDERERSHSCSECGRSAIEDIDEKLTPCCPWCGSVMCNAKIGIDD